MSDEVSRLERAVSRAELARDTARARAAKARWGLPLGDKIREDLERSSVLAEATLLRIQAQLARARDKAGK